MVRKRSQEAALGRLLAASETAVYVIDDGRRIIYCNAACGALLGLDPDQLVGRRCDYGVAGEADAMAATIASLCPPPDVFAGLRRSEEVAFAHASGSVVCRLAEFLPLGHDALGGVGVVTLVFDTPTAGAARTGDSEAIELHRRLVALRHEVLAKWPIDALVGESPAVRRIREQVALAARGRTRVVVLGPAGSGRGHVARLVHHRLTTERPGMCVPLCCKGTML